MELSNYDKAYALHNITGLAFMNGNKEVVLMNYRKILKLLGEKL